MLVKELKLPFNPPYREVDGDTELDLENFRRASVAIVVRSSPRGEELLLIKRTERPEDRWSGHIALPGGRHEEGESDYDTAVREAEEEVGLDLANNAKCLGALPSRMIRVSGGTKPVLILCPYLFYMNESIDGESNSCSLAPQESEVAAVFWYPIPKLQDPAYEGVETVPLRAEALPTYSKETVARGLVEFYAINLEPEEGTVVSSCALPPLPWKMWGITLRVVSELLILVETSSAPAN